MKLRNKKTGKIINSDELLTDKFILDLFSRYFDHFNSILHKIEDEWEDYEEPKEHYFITEYGEVFSLNEYEGLNNVANPEDYKAIGNYFDTREEAEKAVEKLKAWKRLKDKGFKAFSSNICGDDFIVNFKLTNHVDYSQSIDDLDCILDFGGEE